MKTPLRITRFTCDKALLCLIAVVAFSIPALAQQSGDAPSIVQPGAPGQPTKELPAGTTAKLPPISAKDIGFMQGMIVHHAQAVEMVALMEGRTETPELVRLGARISQSQSDEIGFMRRWLTVRGQKAPSMMSGMKMDHDQHADHKMNMDGGHASMPGMLTAEQMKELAAAKGAEFDMLFLKGMIQHHIGALIMVKDLFETAGAGQDAEIFNFATDVDSGQRAEIKVMQNMLGETAKERN